MLLSSSNPYQHLTQSPYLKALLALIALHAMMQMFVPVVGDEAYFISWGKVFSFGVYDHPGAPGWLSHLLWQVNKVTGLDALVGLHRNTLILLQIANLWFFYVYLRLNNDCKSSLNIILLLVALPTHIIMFSLYLNDTLLTLLLFQFFLCIGFSWHYRDNPRKAYVYSLAAGLFLGLAFLTKYTAIVFYGALAISLLFTTNKRRFLVTKFLTTSVVGFLMLGANLYWNYFNCQINLAFNFIYRSSGSLMQGALELFLSLLFLLGPLWFLIYRHKKEITRNKDGVFAHLFISTIIVFSIVTIMRGHFGLHWGAGIIIIATLALAEVINPQSLQTNKCVTWNLAYSILIISPLIGIMILIQSNNFGPVSKLLDEEQKYTLNLIFDISDGSLAKNIKDNLSEDIIISTSSYGITAMLDVAGVKNTRLMFDVSKYGRNSDVLYDYRAMHGRDILFIPTELDEKPAHFNAHFDSAEELTLIGSRGPYSAFLGHGFKYPVYNDTTLTPLIIKLYNHTPNLYGGCFMDKYR